MSSTTGTVPRTGASTETGLDENVAGALAYLLGLVTGVLFLVVEGENRFVRHHAAQSIVLHVAAIGVAVVIWVLDAVLSGIPVVGVVFGAVFWLVWGLFAAGGLAVWLFVMYRAYSHDRFYLPVVGRFARSIAS